MTSNTKPTLLSWLTLLLLSLVWGSSFILIKRGLVAYSSDQVGALRITFAFLTMLPFSLQNLRKIPKQKMGFIVFSGFIGTLIPAFLFAVAETNLSSSIAGVVNALTPLFTILIAVLVFKNKTKSTQIIGLLTAFLGVTLLSFINNIGSLGNLNYYVLFVIIATVCYGANTNVIKVYLSDFNAITLTSLAMLFIGPICILYLFLGTDFTNVLNSHQQSWSSLGYLVILGGVGTSGALVLFNQLIRTTSPVFAVTVTYLIPIVAILWGLVDGEQLFPLHYFGFLMILVGVYITNK